MAITATGRIKKTASKKRHDGFTSPEMGRRAVDKPLQGAKKLCKPILCKPFSTAFCVFVKKIVKFELLSFPVKAIIER